MADYKNISICKDNELCWVLTLNSKILNLETRRDLINFFSNFYPEAEKKPKALIITGKDNVFCAGADLKELKFLADNFNEQGLREFLKSGRDIMYKILNLPIITIAAINGYALGGGLELAMACDFRFAAHPNSASLPDPILGLPEANLGFPSGWLGTVLLPRIVGMNKAKNLILSGKKISPCQAIKIELIDDIFDRERLVDYVKAFSGDFSDFQVIKILKENFRKQRFWGSDDFDFIKEAILEEEAFIECFRNDSAKRGIEKFFASREKK